tara:strand:+ start:1751 stop:2917 length:1167 start_codon:yes stop_codon:yes gene_type:complete
MSKKRKICIVSGTRADFGLLTPLLNEINNDKDLELQLVVTGMHLSPEFGSTYKVIEEQFNIDKKVEMVLSSDSAIGISKSMGLAQISFAEAFNDLEPDIVLVLGDRYEIFSVVVTAMMHKIPIAHLSGGEITEGAIDDSIRHAITKMSHLHFVATEEYKNRVIQLGENVEHIYNFGELGLDNLEKMEFLNKEAFEESIDFKLAEKSLLITYHPTTLEHILGIKKDFIAILEQLDSLEDTSLIFTKSNSDEGGRMINAMIEDYVALNKQKAKVFTSLGHLRYLSALQHVDAIIGNTSSGIVEAPSFKLATINVGNRQKGRLQAENVINTSTKPIELKRAFEILYSIEFQNSLQYVTNPYFSKGNASQKTKEILKNVNLKNIIHKKFFDL